MPRHIVNHPSKPLVLPGLFGLMAKFLRKLADSRRDRRLLSGLNEYQLRDIGLRRDQPGHRYNRY